MKTPPGRIRIIAGSLRNSRLDVPSLAGLRPTSERVRETLFNWLVPTIEGAHCLDLCAGTGALGIEALSRGAASVQFVEPDPAAARALGANLIRLKQSAKVFTGDALHFLSRAPQPFDLVFLDPPFALNLWQPLAERLEQGWLGEAAMIYVEYPHSETPMLPAAWHVQRESHAGTVRFALYRRAQIHPLS